MKRIILSILLILVLASSASSFDITFKNTTNTTLIYRLHWLACDWKDFPKETEMVVGELSPGKNSIMGVDYKPGPYTISWNNLSSSSTKFYRGYKFTVEDGKHIILSMPYMMPVRLATLKEKYNAINRALDIWPDPD